MKNRILNILTVVFALTFVISGFFLVRYYVNSDKQEKVYHELSQLMEQGEESAAPENETEQPQSPYVAVIDPKGNTQMILRQFEALYKKNPDVYGWMRIEGTVVDYPVMYKPEKEEFYLRKNFFGEKATHGCLYIQESCSVEPRSDNLTVYGHNMRDGSMFGCLKNYRKKDFWQAHPVITFNTLKEEARYEIFGVFITTASMGEGFAYHTFVDLPGEETFNAFVDTCKKLSLYDTGIDPQPGDQLLTLSTCNKSMTNGRLVVVARRITQ